MTPRERECLQAIKDLTVDGVPPNYDALAARLGVASKSGVSRMIESLVAQGYLRKRFAKRNGLTVVDHPVIFDQDLNRMSEADLVALGVRVAAALARKSGAQA